MDAKTRITPNGRYCYGAYPNVAEDKTLERHYYAIGETKDHEYSNNRISPTP